MIHGAYQTVAGCFILWQLGPNMCTERTQWSELLGVSLVCFYKGFYEGKKRLTPLRPNGNRALMQQLLLPLLLTGD
jgi:hypothetical protein